MKRSEAMKVLEMPLELNIIDILKKHGKPGVISFKEIQSMAKQMAEHTIFCLEVNKVIPEGHIKNDELVKKKARKKK